MSKQIKITRYGFFQTKNVQIKEWKQVNEGFSSEVIMHSFLVILNKVLEFPNFLTDLVLVSNKPASCKKIRVVTKERREQISK